MTANGGFYTVFPSLLVMAESGQGEQVSVTSVRVRVLDRKPIGLNPTKVTCGHGAGSVVPGSLITVDTRTDVTTLEEANGSTSQSIMPPARLVLKNIDGESVDVRIKGEMGFAYSGIVEVKGVVNGKPTVRLFGSVDRPFRWAQIPDAAFPMRGSYDWDTANAKWTQELSSP